MRPPTPLQNKTPFAIDRHPLQGTTTARAGLAAVSRALRSLSLPGQADANLHIKKRDRGYTAGQFVESLVMLHTAGGDCMEDIEPLRGDEGITKMLGYCPPSARAIGDFLDLFHDAQQIESARKEADQQKRLAIIPAESSLLVGLGRVQQGSVQAMARGGRLPSCATIDQDATIIESQKRTATTAYEGSKGYQPMVAVWAEADLIVADEFRDGNVPAGMAPLACAQAAFAALPGSVTERYFRGDSACHENNLLRWLQDPKRVEGPTGLIGFAISARLSEELGKAMRRVPEKQWQTIGREADGTLRQWMEVDFVPGEKSESKDRWPLRYVGLRLLKAQGSLFADGTDRHYHAVITNLDWKGDRILNWHRKKAGTVEHVHNEIKNGLGGGRLPSANFGANAAWFRIACIAYNIVSAVRHAWPDEALHNAQIKRLRFEIFGVTGRFVRDRRKISLRLAASVEWIRKFQKLFDQFPLAYRATG